MSIDIELGSNNKLSAFVIFYIEEIAAGPFPVFYTPVSEATSSIDIYILLPIHLGQPKQIVHTTLSWQQPYLFPSILLNSLMSLLCPHHPRHKRSTSFP